MAPATQTAAVPPSRKPVVAICLRHYLPGYKSGGPVRTIANLVDHLGDEFDFRIVTSDRDLRDDRPYPDVAIDGWQAVGKARVYYASPATQTLAGITKVLNGIDADVIYLNSFFDGRFTILPLLARRLGMLRQRRVIVAPRGEFAASALRIRAWKKAPYRLVARLTGLYRGVTWHASSEYEREDIRRRMGDRAAAATSIAVNLPGCRVEADSEAWGPRRPGEPLRVVFVARIAPMKNLDYALRVASSSSVPLDFDIYGMVDDQRYWEQCRDLMSRMPGHVRVTWHGPLPPDQVGRALATHDVLFLPTRGENYGHVIAESLLQGTPVLISDRTPWRGLPDVGAGWDLPLEETGRDFRAALATLSELTSEASLELRRRAAAYARAALGDSRAVEAVRCMIQSAAAG